MELVHWPRETEVNKNDRQELWSGVGGWVKKQYKEKLCSPPALSEKTDAPELGVCELQVSTANGCFGSVPVREMQWSFVNDNLLTQTELSSHNIDVLECTAPHNMYMNMSIRGPVNFLPGSEQTGIWLVQFCAWGFTTVTDRWVLQRHTQTKKY